MMSHLLLWVLFVLFSEVSVVGISACSVVVVNISVMFIDGSFSVVDHSFVDASVTALDVSVVCDGGSSVADDASLVEVEFSSGGSAVVCSDVTWDFGGPAAGAAIVADEAPV